MIEVLLLLLLRIGLNPKDIHLCLDQPVSVRSLAIKVSLFVEQNYED